MPKYRIYIPVKAEDVYEIEAGSKEEARKYVDEVGLDYEQFMFTTDPEEMKEQLHVPEIEIEEWD